MTFLIYTSIGLYFIAAHRGQSLFCQFSFLKISDVLRGSTHILATGLHGLNRFVEV